MYVDVIESSTSWNTKRPHQTINLSSDSVLKCGELFVSKTADKWIFFCTYCQKASNNIGVFICHIHSEHLNGQKQISEADTGNMYTEKATPFSSSEEPPPNDIIMGKETIDRTDESAEKIICSKVTKIVDISSVSQPNSDEIPSHTAEQNSLSIMHDRRKNVDDFITIALLNEDKNPSFVQIQGSNSNFENSVNLENDRDSDTRSCYIPQPNQTGSESVDDENGYIGPSATLKTNPKNKQNKKRKNPPISYKCTYCEQVFSTKQAMFYHIECVHDKDFNKKLLYKCCICDRRFSSMSGLRMHKRSHQDKYNFVCPVCGTRLLDYYFIGHVMSHESDTCYPCQVCGKVYTTNGERVKHWETHAKEMPYFCRICFRRYRRYHILVHHLKKHNQYNCSRCKAKYNSVDSQKHPYVCNKCKKMSNIKGKGQTSLLEKNAVVLDSNENFDQELKLKTEENIINPNTVIKNEEDENDCSELEFIKEKKTMTIL